MDTNTTVTDSKTNNLSAIERALAAAKARKAAAAAATPTVMASNEEPASSSTPAVPTLSKEDKAASRAAKKAQIEADREARRQAREAKAATKVSSETQKESRMAHMKKVERAASKLPPLAQDAQLQVNDIVSNFTSEQITAIALHLQHHNRVMATQRAAATKLEVGMTVQIRGGEARFVGLTGTVDEVRRIRCYVTVPGLKNRVYCFTSDVVEVQPEAPLAAAG